MNDMYKDVKEFHEKFNIPVAGKEPCRIPDYLVIEYRTKFLEEELNEFKLAAAQSNMVEMLDALADIAWVALGTAHYFRAPFDEIWNEVKRANMDRVMATRETCPPDKRYRKDMVIKPPGWEAPKILQVVAQYNRRVKQLVVPPRDEFAMDEGAFGGELDPYSPGAQHPVNVLKNEFKKIGLQIDPEREREVRAFCDEMVSVEIPIIGVINVDNPADPRHKELLEIPAFLLRCLCTGEYGGVTYECPIHGTGTPPSVEEKHPLGCPCRLCDDPIGE